MVLHYVVLNRFCRVRSIAPGNIRNELNTHLNTILILKTKFDLNLVNFEIKKVKDKSFNV